MSNEQWQTNLLNINVWLRLLFMVLTSICMVIAWYLIGFVAVVQFLLVLITGKDDDNLRNFGQGVSKWAGQGLLFLTFNSDTKPYPFSEWPDIDATEPYIAPEAESSAEPNVQEPVITVPSEPVDDTAETGEELGGEAEVQLDDEVFDTEAASESAPETDIPAFVEDTSVNEQQGEPAEEGDDKGSDGKNEKA